MKGGGRGLGGGGPIIMTGCLKSRENWNPGMPIFTGVYIYSY